MPGSAKRAADDERLVNRLKHSNPQKFEELVKVHLSFLLDLPGSSLEEFLEPPKQSKASKLISKSKKRLGWEQQNSKSREGGVFGQVLSAETMEAVLSIIRHLNQPKFVSEEGLFRKSGNERRKRALISAINSGKTGEELDTCIYSAHDLAEVIKLYVKELPEPLLTHKHNTAYCQIQGFESEQKKIRTVQLLLQLLPKENYIFLQTLLTLLNAVAKEKSTLMTSQTLGLLFAPHVMASRPTGAEQLRDQVVSGENAALMALLIEHSSDIFKLPEVFLKDVKSYWERMEQTDDSVDFTSSSSLFRAETAGDPIQSCVSFTDRKASAATDDYTQMQLANLYAHIGSMPDGAKKRRYAKKVTANNATPASCTMSEKHRRSKSIGESLKKFVGRSQPRRRNANQSSNSLSSSSSSSLRQDTTFSPVYDDHASERLRYSMIPGPVQALFKHNHFTSPETKKLERDNSKVVVVDMEKENLVRSVHGKRQAPGSNSPLVKNRYVDSPMRMTRSMFRSPAAQSTALQTWLSPAVDMNTPSPKVTQTSNQTVSQSDDKSRSQAVTDTRIPSTTQSQKQSTDQSTGQPRSQSVNHTRTPSETKSRIPAAMHVRTRSGNHFRTPSGSQSRIQSSSHSRTKSTTHSRTRPGNQSRIPSATHSRRSSASNSRSPLLPKPRVCRRSPVRSANRIRTQTFTPTSAYASPSRRHIRNNTTPNFGRDSSGNLNKKRTLQVGLKTTRRVDSPMPTDSPVFLKRLPPKRPSPNPAISPIATRSPLRSFQPKMQGLTIDSPLSQSYKQAPISLQKVMNTPGSRQSVILHQPRRTTRR